MSNSPNLIFQLGTNNWQRGGEFAPGSGILHEAHHHAYNAIANTACFSIYPSSKQQSDDPQVSVFQLDHDIPICESISPVSSYRFHSMSENEFHAYIDRLTRFTQECIAAAEAREGRPVDIAIAHHSFLNPLILSRIKQSRPADEQFRLLTFVHGTALKMFVHEMEGVDPDYPARFLPFMRDEGVFDETGPVDACAAISKEQLEVFQRVFPDFPARNMILSPNGYQESTFHPIDGLYSERSAYLRTLESTIGPAGLTTLTDADIGEHILVFCGKFADWKRLDALLAAVAVLEAELDVTTLIIGAGPDDAIAHYHSLAYDELNLKRAFFLGARAQDEIAKLNTVADLGVFPSRNEPFGLVFIECMACGTPVVGANSGGPMDFVTPDVGELVPEAEGEVLVTSLVSTISKALSENWKQSRGPGAAKYARDSFSIDRQCAQLLRDLARIN